MFFLINCSMAEMRRFFSKVSSLRISSLGSVSWEVTDASYSSALSRDNRCFRRKRGKLLQYCPNWESCTICRHYFLWGGESGQGRKHPQYSKTRTSLDLLYFSKTGPIETFSAKYRSRLGKSWRVWKVEKGLGILKEHEILRGKRGLKGRGSSRIRRRELEKER